MIRSSHSSCSSYSPYTLTEIDNIINGLSKEIKYSEVEIHQTNLNNKLLYIIRDLLIRIEKLENKDRSEEK